MGFSLQGQRHTDESQTKGVFCIKKTKKDGYTSKWLTDWLNKWVTLMSAWAILPTKTKDLWEVENINFKKPSLGHPQQQVGKSQEFSGMGYF